MRIDATEPAADALPATTTGAAAAPPRAPIAEIRRRLGLSQAELGRALGCTQGNVYLLERGQQLMPEVARALLACARERGLALTWSHLYDGAELPEPAEAGGRP